MSHARFKISVTFIVFLVSDFALAEPMTVPPSQVHLNGYTATLTPTSVDFGAPAIVVDLSTAVPTGTVFSPLGLNVFDNVPAQLGGAGTAGMGTYAFVDWTATGALWVDHITLANTGIITHLTYAYLSTKTGANTTTHSVVLYTGASAPPMTLGSFTGVGAPIATIVLPGLPGTLGGGFVQAVITGLSIPVDTNQIYVGWDELPDDDVFWLTGGIPGVGTSADGVVYWLPNYPLPPFMYAYAFPGPLNLVSGDRIHGNVSFALGVPEPATIGALVVGGLLALRRRRAKLN